MKKYILLLFFIQIIWSNVLEKKIDVGDLAPTFFLYDLNGKKFFLSEELQKNRTIAINFFATWCAPCVEELPLLQTFSENYDNISFYLIHVNNLVQNGKKRTEKSNDIKNLLEKLNIDIQVLMDKYAIVTEKYKALPIPKTVIISSDGVILFLKNGMISQNDHDLLKILEENN